jgi:hypothetical protein
MVLETLGISLFETMRSLALTLEKKARNGFDHFVYSWNLGGKTGRNMFAFVGEALPIGIFFDLLSPRLLGNSISDGIWPTILHE